MVNELDYYIYKIINARNCNRVDYVKRHSLWTEQVFHMTEFHFHYPYNDSPCKDSQCFMEQHVMIDDFESQPISTILFHYNQN
jgi:hypothetical protein